MIRPAGPDDAAAMADLAEARRAEYVQYNPVFHRPAARARERHEPFLAGLVEDERFLCLVHEDAGRVDGFAIGM